MGIKSDLKALAWFLLCLARAAWLNFCRMQERADKALEAYDAALDAEHRALAQYENLRHPVERQK